MTVAAPTALARDIAPGGVPLRIQIAGADLAEAVRDALPAPAAEPAARPVATLEAVTGAEMPPAAWATADRLPSDEVLGFAEGARIAAVMPLHDTVSLYDREQAKGIFWSRSMATLPDWESGAPLCHLLRWALADHGLALLHGAAVGVPGGDGVLPGAGGVGKSTTALACLEADLDVVADDYCLVDGHRTAHRLYSIGKLEPRSLALLPGLAALAGPVHEQGKAHIDLRERYAPAVRLRALVLPRIEERTGAPERVRAVDVYRRVLTATLPQMPGRRAATLAALGDLIRALPAYELPIGPDLDAVVGRMTELCAA